MLKFIIILIAALLFAGYAYEQFDLTFGEDVGSTGTFCPNDQFQCPNGVFVERTGENCEFVCPEF